MTNVFYFLKALEASYCSTLSPSMKKKCYSVWIWILTFLIYTTFHLSRKPISVVKNVLNQNCSGLTPDIPTNDSHWCDWEPFDKDNASALLGILDSAYLFCYAFSMFFSGVIAERSRLNVFLSIGMVGSGIMTAAFGLGYTFNIHAFWYYLIVQMICGIVESSGWPGVVSVMGNWFGKKRRGLVMGIWNCHTSFGNIFGTLIATAFVTTNWGMSFIVPGIIIASMGIIVLFFLVPEPSVVGIENPNSPVHEIDEEQAEGLCFLASSCVSVCFAETLCMLSWQYGVCDTHLQVIFVIIREVDSSPPLYKDIVPSEDFVSEKPISFLAALKIPGVIEFSMSLFFSKLVSYTFLYWLPHFIFDSTSSDADKSGQISTFFDVGGMIGGILAGVLSDSTGMPASTCSVMLVIAIPMIFIYQWLSETVTLLGNMLLLIPVGLLVNGPYSLITTAVSTELGTHPCLQGNSKALSTVSSIIDGTGSIGAAVGPLIAGVLSEGDWSNVFYMMIVADIFSLLFLVRLLIKEIQTFISRWRS